jgi:hypothetical protein
MPCDLTSACTTAWGDRNLLFGVPGRSGQGPRRDLGGGQGNCPTSASRVLSGHIPESGWSIRHTGHGCQGERGASRIGSGGLRAHGGTAPGARPRRSQGQLTRRQCDPLQGRRQRVPRPAGCGCGWARIPGESGSSLSAACLCVSARRQVPGTGRSMTSGCLSAVSAQADSMNAMIRMAPTRPYVRGGNHSCSQS